MELPEDATLGGKKMPDSIGAQKFRIRNPSMNIYKINESTTFFEPVQPIPIT
jgi:hypothetical protein